MPDELESASKNFRESTRNDELIDGAVDLVRSFGDLIPFIPAGTIAVNAISQLISYQSRRFYKKLHHFLIPIGNVKDSYEKINSFMNELSDKNRQELVDYLMGLLNASESDSKALVMGYIYKAAVLNKIDHSTMLRLCSIIKSIFVNDLTFLPKYVNEYEEETIETQSFINLGLIDNEPGGIWKGNPSYQLNELGQTLYEILANEHYFENTEVV